MTKLRRNDVVLVGATRTADDGTEYMDMSWGMYGRVVARVDADHVRVIDCGKHHRVLPDAWLKKEDYDGTWEWGIEWDGHLRNRFPVYRLMPTLRELKQNSACYNPDVWRKPKKSRRLHVAYPEFLIEHRYYKPPYDFIEEDYRTRFYHDWMVNRAILASRCSSPREYHSMN